MRTVMCAVEHDGRLENLRAYRTSQGLVKVAQTCERPRVGIIIDAEHVSWHCSDATRSRLRSSVGFGGKARGRHNALLLGRTQQGPAPHDNSFNFAARSNLITRIDGEAARSAPNHMMGNNDLFASSPPPRAVVVGRCFFLLLAVHYYYQQQHQF